MPLAFPSITHGTIAFGYFNIEIDMLLLERYFFFGPSFCQAVVALAEAAAAPGADAAEGTVQVAMEGIEVADRAAAGNVNAAIHGLDLSGLIGATYRRFPFPDTPEGFKQKPYGIRNRDWAEETARRFGTPRSIPLTWNTHQQRAAIGDISFDRGQFAALIAYVDRGGYPRWQDEERPAHVQKMMEELRGSESPLVAGLIE